MAPRTAVLLLLLCAGSVPVAEVDPNELARFDLTGSSLLAGFVKSDPAARGFPPIVENPPGATAAINRRYFHGPTELKYSVLLFPTTGALHAWEERRRATSSMVPRRVPPDRLVPVAGAILHDEGGHRRSKEEAGSAQE